MAGASSVVPRWIAEREAADRMKPAKKKAAPESSHSGAARELSRDDQGTAGHAPHQAAGLATRAEIAQELGLPIATVDLWIDRGGLVEAFPGFLDRDQVFGLIRRAAKGGR